MPFHTPKPVTEADHLTNVCVMLLPHKSGETAKKFAQEALAYGGTRNILKRSFDLGRTNTLCKATRACLGTKLSNDSHFGKFGEYMKNELEPCLAKSTVNLQLEINHTQSSLDPKNIQQLIDDANRVHILALETSPPQGFNLLSRARLSQAVVSPTTATSMHRTGQKYSMIVPCSLAS